MFIYLFTNPHAHVCGLYYLPDAFIVHETTLKQESIDTLWDTLSGSGLVWRDKATDMVWVKSMLKRQGRGEKILRAVASHLKTLHNCCAIPEFLSRYPAAKRYFKDRVSVPHPAQDESGIQYQEQEQDIPLPAAPEEKKPEKEIKSPAEYRQLTDYVVSRHPLFAGGRKFAKTEGVFIADLWGRVNGDLGWAKATIDSYLAESNKSYEGHPLNLFKRDMDKFISRARGIKQAQKTQQTREDN